MKINTRIVASLFLVCIGFFFTLAALDFVVMSVFNIAGFAGNSDLLFRYWMVLTLVVVVVGFAVSFIGYLSRLPTDACVMLFLTFILLFAGGLLDLFYALFSYIQNQSYDFKYWSIQWKLWGFWSWSLQMLWSIGFYGAIVAIWYWMLRKK